MPEERSAAQDITLPNMTQDEPEREKVEKSVNFLRACAAWFRSEAADATEDKAHWARVYNAENCDKAADLLSTALVISQNYQSLMVTAQRERDEAKAQAKLDRETLQAREMLGGALGMDMNECVVEATKRVCKQYERERDSLRSSLAEIEKRTLNLSTFGALERAIDFIRTVARSALRRSQGE